MQNILVLSKNRNTIVLELRDSAGKVIDQSIQTITDLPYDNKDSFGKTIKFFNRYKYSSVITLLKNTDNIKVLVKLLETLGAQHSGYINDRLGSLYITIDEELKTVVKFIGSYKQVSNLLYYFNSILEEKLK